MTSTTWSIDIPIKLSFIIAKWSIKYECTKQNEKCLFEQKANKS